MAATRASLRADLVRLGVRPGDVIMVHASLRRVGQVTGGASTVIQALLDTIGTAGTLTAYVDFEPFFEEGDLDVPAFDKRIARAARDHGVLHETLRTWPGAVRSDHPDAGVVAVGALAEWISSNHPFTYGYGEGSPFEKIVDARGRLLMLGAPLDTITLLHLADHRARIPNKRVRRYRRLLATPDGPRWTDFEEFETAEPVHASLPDDYFDRITQDYLAAGRGTSGMVGAATAVLLDGADLVAFAVAWLERAVAKH